MRHGHSHREHDRRFAHPEHHHDHGRRGRGGRQAARLFEHGELRLVVLALVAERPRHGYEIIKAIEERTAGTYNPSPGVVYPTLAMLEDLGHATVAEADGKKRYAITADGHGYLAANQAALDTALGRMRLISTAHGGGPALEIVRATENLKLALRLRQGRGPLTEDQVRAIAATLDAAAVAVERG